jgi:hypothetical protein
MGIEYKTGQKDLKIQYNQLIRHDPPIPFHLFIVFPRWRWISQKFLVFFTNKGLVKYKAEGLEECAAADSEDVA